MKSHQYRWLVGGNDLEVGHFQKWLPWWLPGRSTAWLLELLHAWLLELVPKCQNFFKLCGFVEDICVMYVSNTFIIVTMPFVHTVKSYRRR